MDGPRAGGTRLTNSLNGNMTVDAETNAKEESTTKPDNGEAEAGTTATANTSQSYSQT